MFFVLIIGLVIAIYWFYSRNNDYWKKYEVPYVEPTFFFGNMKDVLSGKIHLGTLYYDLYKKFQKFPYNGYFKMHHPGVMINDLELIKNVLVKDFNSFAENDFQIDYEIDPIWGSNAFVQVGEKWKKTRNAWTSSLTPTRIKNLYEKITETSDVIVDHIENHIKDKPNEPIELRFFSAQCFTDAIVNSIFGVKNNSFKDPDNPYLTVAQSLFVSTFWDGLITLLFLISPWVAKMLKIRFVKKEMEKELLKVSKPIIESRKPKGFDKSNPFDSIILFNGEDSISEIEVAGIVFGFLLDGTETSSGVGGFALYSMAANMDIQHKLQAEIDQAIENNGGNFSHQIIQDLPYLDMFLNETMRMYPALLSTQRICTKDYELPPIKPGAKPAIVKKGMTAVISIQGLHMNPEYYPNPEKFDPERFSAENKASIPKFAYLPFGDGPRVCLGARFAVNQTKIILANLIRNFEIRLAPQMIGKPIVIDPNIFVYRNTGGLWGTFHKRKFN